VGSFVTEGIVIGARRYAEADRLIVIFTRDRGKLSAIAKSARKPRSKLRGGTEAFVRANFEFAEGKTLSIVRHAEVISAGLKLRDDWKLLQLAGHISEIAKKLSEEHVPDEEFYELIANAIEKVGEGDIEAVQIFKAKTLEHMGIFPEIGRCMKCGTSKSSGIVHLDLTRDGFLCADCAADTQVYHPVSMKVLHLLRTLYETGSVPDEFSDDDREKADEVMTLLLQGFIQAPFKTWRGAKKYLTNKQTKNPR
jgi:DNA repair protein RecO (recombination protein O)